MPPSSPAPAAAPCEPTVFVVDDNPALSCQLRGLLESVQLRVQIFTSAAAYLEHFDARQAGCLLLDVRMPGMSGLDLQQQLRERLADCQPPNAVLLPILFMSGHGDIRMAMRAVRSGAFDFLEKPLQEQDLLDRVHHALRADAETRRGARQRQHLLALLDRLSPREREVLDHVVQGQSNKAIARGMDLSAKTVEVHRASMMAKLQAHSVAEVVRLALQAQLPVAAVSLGP